MYELIHSRDGAIQETAQMMENAQNQILGMGHTIAWVEISRFAEAISQANKRIVNVNVLAAKVYGAKQYFKKLEKLGAKVRYSDHGDVRVALTDHRNCLISFPLPIKGDDPVREYETIYIEDETLARWLERRFYEYWEMAEKRPLEATKAERIKYFWAANSGKIITGIITAAVGAILTAWLKN